jgi:hypothetical protein
MLIGIKGSWADKEPMAVLLHELWLGPGDEEMFCLAGPMGDGARATLGTGAQLAWTVEAGSHFEAMTRYYEFVGRGRYTTDQEWDHLPYSEDWRSIQRSGP